VSVSLLLMLLLLIGEILILSILRYPRYLPNQDGFDFSSVDAAEACRPGRVPPSRAYPVEHARQHISRIKIAYQEIANQELRSQLKSFLDPREPSRHSKNADAFSTICRRC
jgi:hypothetical protein